VGEIGHSNESRFVVRVLHASGPIPKFVSTRDTFRYELRN
jgi:hypothetical protein